MAASGRRAAASKNRSAPRAAREKASGILVVPRIAHERATRLIQINAVNELSFRKKRAAAQAGRIHGLNIINGPGSRRSTAGSKPSGHGINAPRGQW